MDLSNVKKVIQIHTNTGGGAFCEICQTSVDGGIGGEIARPVNHFLEHGYKLLHIGAEWGTDSNGKSITHTTAILGTDE